MTVAAPIVSIAALITLYGFLDSAHRGLDAKYWHRIRKQLLPILDRIARRFGLGYATYQLQPEEFAGHINKPVSEVENILAENGFERMPLSAWKTLEDGRCEVGSWARRDGVLADFQIHVMLFRAEGNRTDLYAHEEYNPFHPAHATKHYEFIGHDPEAGTQRVADILADHLEAPSTDEPAASEDKSVPPETTRIGTGVELPSAVDGDAGAAAD